MNQAESIMELLPMIGKIEPTGNYLKFTARQKSYQIHELDKAKQDIQKICRALELMGVRDIPIRHAMSLEVNYIYAAPAQKKILDAIQLAQVRFEALRALYNNGGMQPTAVETAYFNKLTQQRIAARAAAQKTK